MGEAVICTPLAVEHAAVAPALPDLTVLRTGRGPARSAASAARAGLRDRPVAVAGLAGAVAAGLRPGDLVVATEVRGSGAAGNGVPVPVPAAPLVAGALRRAGLPVRLGPVHTSERIVHGAERAAFAADGVLAVDMESAQLATGAAGHPVLVVRAVVDTPEHPLLRPGTAGRGVRALRNLRAAAPVIRQWQAALGARELVLASPRSFCAGVSRAIEIVERALERYSAPVYVRRQIVHNAHVVRQLEAKGARFVLELDEVPPGARVILAAHGVAPEVHRQAAERDLQVIDATCPLVTKVHNEVRRFTGRGDTVFLIGHADHEEVVGTHGQAPEQVIVVGDAREAAAAQAADPDRVAYAMQTTLAVDEADQIADVLRQRFPKLAAPSRDDICYATTNRQRAIRAIAAETDLVLVVGSANSSNSARLVEVAERAGTPAHLVEDAGEVDLRWLAGAHRIGISAGASAPPHLVDELARALSGLGPVDLRTTHVVDEHMQFSLPREVS
ncbi:MAG TPA: 4-hydroxy-3-methylbut-2-enyl diphosphate reductase [Jatrophihabitans sp.]|nr:4-hydroxy-3-methylbut-2-enyl diphosphate reductase [Jatrophihabitans sp.]